MHFHDVIEFWFSEIDSKAWWVKDSEFDQQLKVRFGALLNAAVQGELYEWRSKPEGRLAEVIVIDQFSRNIYRGTPQAFASDSMALALSQEAIQSGDDLLLDSQQRVFLYMPFMHSESARIHEIAVELFTRISRGKNLEFELKHKAIIDRFGRYPHRNEILGRESTPEEIEFLSKPGSSF